MGTIAEVGKAAWDDCANPGWPSETPLARRPDQPTVAYNPFVSFDFLQCLEESGCVGRRSGWTPTHFVLEDASAPVAAAPAYLKAHSMGEYVFDHGWADAYERAGGHYYPKLQIAVPFTPVTGPRLLTSGRATPEARTALAGAAIASLATVGASSAHTTFVSEAEATLLAGHGWLHRTDRQFHFINEGYRDFADFLDALASRKRKAVRRERRDALAGGVEIECLTGKEISETHWDAFFAFYMDTGSRKWGRPYLNRRFFSLIGERMADRVLMILARRSGRPIAGALNFVGSDTLYGRYWGTTDAQPFLHFEVCYYQAVEWGIARGLKVVEAGAQGEHKIARGYVPVTTHSAHWIADPSFRRAVADYLRREREAVAAEQTMLADQAPFRHEDAAEMAGDATPDESEV
ncbi:MAG: GNAT family N-acetyltransferase [Bauldia sp.]